MKEVSFKYDKKEGKYQTNKINKETIYYLGVAKICPKCKDYIIGYPAISRVDNKTEICSKCGTLEALEIFTKHRNKNRSNNHGTIF